MKEVTSSSGEKELQTPEHVPVGPVVVTNGPIESLKKQIIDLNLVVAKLLKRIDVLEAQVKSLQCATPGSIPGLAKTK